MTSAKGLWATMPLAPLLPSKSREKCDALQMSGIAISTLVKCAERELGLRQTVYPRKMAGDKMSLQKARHEIECMRRILDVLKEMEAEHSRKLKLFA
jgi:hypothetical protein